MTFRKWFTENHDKEKECWIFVKVGFSKTALHFDKLMRLNRLFVLIDNIAKNTLGIGLSQKISPIEVLRKSEMEGNE